MKIRVANATASTTRWQNEIPRDPRIVEHGWCKWVCTGINQWTYYSNSSHKTSTYKFLNWTNTLPYSHAKTQHEQCRWWTTSCRQGDRETEQNGEREREQTEWVRKVQLLTQKLISQQKNSSLSQRLNSRSKLVLAHHCLLTKSRESQCLCSVLRKTCMQGHKQPCRVLCRIRQRFFCTFHQWALYFMSKSMRTYPGSTSKYKQGQC